MGHMTSVLVEKLEAGTLERVEEAIPLIRTSLKKLCKFQLLSPVKCYYVDAFTMSSHAHAMYMC